MFIVATQVMMWQSSFSHKSLMHHLDPRCCTLMHIRGYLFPRAPNEADGELTALSAGLCTRLINAARVAQSESFKCTETDSAYTLHSLPVPRAVLLSRPVALKRFIPRSTSENIWLPK